MGLHKMQYELSVSVHDLRVILIGIIETGISVGVKTSSGVQLEDCLIAGFDSEFDIVVIAPERDPGREKNISIFLIDSIEFNSFHQYRGEAAKIFQIR